MIELTSGLDSFTAYTIVKVMKDISRRGRTVITIVHQPSTDIFNLFDRIYLLSAGKEVYQVFVAAFNKRRERLESSMDILRVLERKFRPILIQQTS